MTALPYLAFMQNGWLLFSCAISPCWIMTRRCWPPPRVKVTHRPAASPMPNEFRGPRSWTLKGPIQDWSLWCTAPPPRCTALDPCTEDLKMHTVQSDNIVSCLLTLLMVQNLTNQAATRRQETASCLPCTCPTYTERARCPLQRHVNKRCLYASVPVIKLIGKCS